MRDKWSSAVLVTAVGLALLTWAPSLDAREKKALVDDSSDSCSGSTVGKVIQAAGTTTVKVKITNGTPGTTRNVYETCQSGSGCHDGCGFTSLGTITTDGTGFARKKFTRVRADPVHYDICTDSCSSLYFSGVFTSPGVAGAAVAESGGEAVEGGDPARQ
jgi:hypothetical protein